MQAIITKYVSPSNTKGPRIKATAEAGSITLPWNHEVSVEQNHRTAAMWLAEKVDWTKQPNYKGVWIGGHLPSGEYVFVLSKSDNTFEV